MAYDPVTVEMFRTRFPIFEDNSDEQIQMLLDEATGRVGKNWREGDYQPAIMYLAAHMLSLDSSQEGDEIGIGGSGAGKVVASESISGMSVSYFNPNGNSSVSSSEYLTTEYGRRYWKLLRLNFLGPVAV